MSQEQFLKYIKSLFETAIEKAIPPEDIAFKNVVIEFIIDFFVSPGLYSLTEKADLSTELAISKFMDSVFKPQMGIRIKQMIEKHPEFDTEKHSNLLVSFFSMAQFLQFKLPDFNANQKIQSATIQKEILVEAYLTTAHEKTEKLFRKHIDHLDWEIQKNTSANGDIKKTNLDELNKVIERIPDQLVQKINAAINKAEAKQNQKSVSEIPILLPRALEITGLKERAFRAKLAAGDIKCFKRDGKLQFLESELIARQMEGRIKTRDEIKVEADIYLKKSKLKIKHEYKNIK